MSEKAKELINLLYADKLTQFGKRQLSDLIEKQQTKIKELEADLYSANCTINDYIEERNKLKDKLKEHKKDLDYEPWSIYKIDGKVLFDLVNIMGE